MGNGTFLAAAVLLEKQTERLDSQARLRERAKASAVELARRAQVAQAEARQATLNASEVSAGGGAGGPGEGGNTARTVAMRAVEAARVASQAAEDAVAEARRLAAEKGAERWLGADALSTLLAALLECRMVMEGGAEWTAAAGGGGARPIDGGGGNGDAALSSPVQVAQRTCKAIMMQVGVLSEEELKKESPDVSVLECSGRPRVGTNVFDLLCCSRVHLVYASWSHGVRVAMVTGLPVMDGCPCLLTLFRSSNRQGASKACSGGTQSA